MAELVFNDVHVAQGARDVLHGVTAKVRPGELVALIGPNGAGKTTLLRAGLGLMSPNRGSVRLADDNPSTMNPIRRARTVAYLPQVRPLVWPLTVAAVVALGRFAHGASLARPKGQDAEAISRALYACRLEDLALRRTDSLSGGEMARVHVARALAAEAPLLIADEPITALDPLHAFETMALIKAFCAGGGGALVTLHDLSLAVRFADRVILLNQGRLIADGGPETAMSPALLAQVFGINAAVMGTGVIINGPVSPQRTI